MGNQLPAPLFQKIILQIFLKLFCNSFFWITNKEIICSQSGTGPSISNVAYLSFFSVAGIPHVWNIRSYSATLVREYKYKRESNTSEESQYSEALPGVTKSCSTLSSSTSSVLLTNLSKGKTCWSVVTFLQYSTSQLKFAHVHCTNLFQNLRHQ